MDMMILSMLSNEQLRLLVSPYVFVIHPLLYSTFRFNGLEHIIGSEVWFLRVKKVPLSFALEI